MPILKCSRHTGSVERARKERGGEIELPPASGGFIFLVASTDFLQIHASPPKSDYDNHV